MIPKLQQGFTNIGKQQEELLTQLEKLSHEQVNFQPSADSWSILQVIQHLISAESNTNIYLRKKILAGDSLENAGLGTALKSFIMNNAVRTPLKFKAPPSVDKKMDDEYFFEKQANEWRSQRENIGTFLEDIDEKTSNKLLFKHGTGIRLNLSQMLTWMYAHVSTHSKQIKKIVNHPQFPKH